MKLKRPLPPNRSFEQVEHHYLVEKSIAERLKKASREERKLIYSTMYDELFREVPDHPRLTRRDSEQLTEAANRNKLSVVGRFLTKSDVFVEFAPGDCKFSMEAAKHVKFAYGIDISDQRDPSDDVPENFKLVLYDGYDLDGVDNESIDIVFSDQLIEHFHPEETKLHFEIVHRMLKAGGKYVFRTPHALTGPHDVSMYFSDEPDCFHLKEWTYIELKALLMDVKYSKFQTRWRARKLDFRVPYYYFAACEHVLGRIPKRYRRYATKLLIPTLCGVAIK